MAWVVGRVNYSCILEKSLIIIMGSKKFVNFDVLNPPVKLKFEFEKILSVGFMRKVQLIKANFEQNRQI